MNRTKLSNTLSLQPSSIERNNLPMRGEICAEIWLVGGKIFTRSNSFFFSVLSSNPAGRMHIIPENSHLLFGVVFIDY